MTETEDVKSWGRTRDDGADVRHGRPADQRCGRTRLVANPAGYRYEAKEGFNPALVIDLVEATA